MECVNLRVCRPHFARATTLAHGTHGPLYSLGAYTVLLFGNVKGKFPRNSSYTNVGDISLVIAVPRQTLPISDRYLDRHIYVFYHDKKKLTKKGDFFEKNVLFFK